MHTPAPSPDAARREWRPVWLLLLAVMVLWIPYFRNTRLVALQDPDSQDYGHIAINVAAGRGFQTFTQPLMALEWSRQAGKPVGWWNLHRFPLPSLVMAGFIKALGPTTLAVSLFSALFFFASIPLVYLFARRLFPHRVAFLAAFLFALSSTQLEDSVTGHTEPAGIFFFLAALYLVLWKRAWWSLPLAGLLTGLAFLNRTNTVLYAVPMLWLVARAPGRNALANLAAFALPGAAAAAPWLVRNTLVAGNPMFSFTTALMIPYKTALSPTSHDWYQFHFQDPVSFLRAYPTAVLKKWLRETYGIWKDAALLGGLGLWLPFFVASLAKRYEGDAERLRRWLAAVLLLHVAAFGLLSNIPRYYAVFAPFMFMYAADMVIILWDAIRPRLSPRRAAVLAVAAVPLFFLNLARVVRPLSDRPEDVLIAVEANPANQLWIREHTPAGAVILSDKPWSVGWHAQRRSLLLPPTVADLRRFGDYNLSPDGIYLRDPSPARLDTAPATWSQWDRIRRTRGEIPGFRLAHAFRDGALYYTAR